MDFHPRFTPPSSLHKEFDSSLANRYPLTLGYAKIENNSIYPGDSVMHREGLYRRRFRRQLCPKRFPKRVCLPRISH